MRYHHRHSWPRLADREHEVACHFCDSLHPVVEIEEETEARCRTCGRFLYRNRKSSIERAVAFGTTAIVLLLGMISLPFITLEAAGNELSATLAETLAQLWRGGDHLMAIATAIFLLIFPVLQLFGLLWVTVPLLSGRLLPWSRRATRMFQGLSAWVMVEVFFLGTLVSLLKLIKLADVTLGLGFWAMVGVMFCLAAAFGGLDRLELWDRIEVARAWRERQLADKSKPLERRSA